MPGISVNCECLAMQLHSCAISGSIHVLIRKAVAQLIAGCYAVDVLPMRGQKYACTVSSLVFESRVGQSHPYRVPVEIFSSIPAANGSLQQDQGRHPLCCIAEVENLQTHFSTMRTQLPHTGPGQHTLRSSPHPRVRAHGMCTPPSVLPSR